MLVDEDDVVAGQDAGLVGRQALLHPLDPRRMRPHHREPEPRLRLSDQSLRLRERRPAAFVARRLPLGGGRDGVRPFGRIEFEIAQEQVLVGVLLLLHEHRLVRRFLQLRVEVV